MMTDKKIAVHVTNEEQWDEIREYYGNEFPYGHGLSYAKNLFRNKELAQTSDGFWETVAYYHDSNEYELLEFSEWQARIKEDHMEKIEVPQAVYDEFNMLNGARSTAFSIFIDVWSSDIRDDIWEYIFGSGNKTKQHQLNLAQVMAGEAEFVPIEETYYWQDKQESWLGYVNNGRIAIFVNKAMADKLTESEIREKTSFDIDKLKKVSD